MKEEQKAGVRLAMRMSALIAIILLCIFAAPFLWSILSPFIVAFIIAATLQPSIRFAVGKLKMKRGIAVTIAVFLLCAVALLLLYWFFSFAVGQVISALSNAGDIVISLTGTLQALSDKLLNSLEYVPANVSDWMRTSLADAFNWLYTTTVSLASGMVSGTVNFALALPEALIYINFLLLAICFITSGYDRLQKNFPGKNPLSLAGKLRSSAGKGMIGYIRVQMIYTLFVLAVSWAWLQFFGFQYSVLIAALAALLELLPLFGNGTLYLPWVAVCLILGDFHTAALVLALHLILYITRKVTEPRLMSDKMGLSPLSSLFFMYVGMKMGGVLGLTFAPVIGVVIVNAWRGGLFEPLLKDWRLVSQAVRKWLKPQESVRS